MSVRVLKLAEALAQLVDDLSCVRRLARGRMRAWVVLGLACFVDSSLLQLEALIKEVRPPPTNPVRGLLRER